MRKPIVLSDPPTSSGGVHPRLEKLSTMPALVDATLVIEKLRVATQVRRTHLARQGKKDIETDELHRRLVSLEEYAEARVTELIQAHPAYYWFTRVKGVGNENIAKVVGLIDIEKAHTVSSLWKFAGWDVQDGAAPKRRKGKKLTYNSQLRVMTWRLGVSLLRAKGLFYHYYLKEKDKYHHKYINKGFKIIATPTGRFCPQCQREVKAKAAKYCPDCGAPLRQKQEPEGVIFEGHLHKMALRKMIKLFLSLLWVVWRQAQGLSTRVPYPAEYLGHDHMIEPEEMCDELEPPLAYAPEAYPPGPSRRTRVVQLTKADLSYAEIGRRLGISRERARQIAVPEKPSDPQAPLTPREGQILAFIAQGYSITEIADALSTRPHTVTNQVAHMNKKLGLRNKAQLVTMAYKRELQ